MGFRKPEQKGLIKYYIICVHGPAALSVLEFAIPRIDNYWPCQTQLMMMSVTAQSADYGAFMRNSMSATADLLQSIERDIQESRQLIQSKNTDERALTQLVSSLEEDNNILLVRVTLFWRASCIICCPYF